MPTGRPEIAERPPAARTDAGHATEQEVLGGQLERIVADLHRLDPLVRADGPDSVHQMRVAVRKLRSLLKTFEVCFDRSVTDPVRAELAWLGGALGRPRDLEVLRSQLAEVVRAQPSELDAARLGSWIDARLGADHQRAHQAAVEAMSSGRYVALVDSLDRLRSAPPWRDERDRPDHQRLARALDRACATLQRAVSTVSAAPDAERAAALHDVRRAAKRVRYAAEPLVPLLGSVAHQRVRAAVRVQTTLGKHHDAVIAAEETVRLAEAAQAEGRDGAILGVLRARLEHEAAEHELAFAQEWKKVRKRLQ